MSKLWRFERLTLKALHEGIHKSIWLYIIIVVTENLQILDVQPAISIMREKHGVALAIEHHWNKPVLFAHAQVKGGGGLDPLSFQIQYGIAMQSNYVGPEQFDYFLWEKVVSDICKSQSSRYAGCSCQSDKKNAFGIQKPSPTDRVLLARNSSSGGDDDG